MQFKNITCYDPYPHQIATYEALAKNRDLLTLWKRDRVWRKAIILRALTGREIGFKKFKISKRN